jgi:EAL and modified HD-GYP domain-containing signal transduction protein
MQTFIARQPILDLRQKTFGYELLFRSGATRNFMDGTDPDQVMTKVIADCATLLGVEHITGGKPAFINVTRDVLLREYVYMLPVGLTVVEILETVEPEADVVVACRKLKDAGYKLALDDFVSDERFRPLVELADIIKVDFLSTTPEDQSTIVKTFRHLGVKFLAEKVETHEIFKRAVELGYSYFQGYYFCKPTIMSNRDISGSQLHYLQILREMNRSDLDFRRIEEIIKQDMSLSYRLLRYVNSVAVGSRNEISSIGKALNILGEREIKKLVSLIALAKMGESKPEALVGQAVIRARFCELLAPHFGLPGMATDLFLLGMFSLTPAILDRELDEILLELPLRDEVKFALLGKKNELREVFDFVEAYEAADWEGVTRQFGNSTEEQFEEQMSGIYLKAVDWAQKGFIDSAGS